MVAGVVLLNPRNTVYFLRKADERNAELIRDDVVRCKVITIHPIIETFPSEAEIPTCW